MDFDDEYRVIIVDDAYLHYEIAYFKSVDRVTAYCERCDKCVAGFDYEEVKSLSPLKLYEMIIECHQKI